ncbi:MAG: hypothetical protein Q4A52_01370 [Bacillota bacterium]|nr:hypothetical protein [Bacillota bacterium]
MPITLIVSAAGIALLFLGIAKKRKAPMVIGALFLAAVLVFWVMLFMQNQSV